MTRIFDENGQIADEAGRLIRQLLQTTDTDPICASDSVFAAMLLEAARHARGARAIAALDRAGALVRVFRQADAMRVCEQNDYHHLPVLAHTFEALERLDELIADPALVSAKYADRLASVLSADSNVRDSNADNDMSDSLNNDALLRLALLFHDAGKPETRRYDTSGRVTFYGHDLIGARIARGFAIDAPARAEGNLAPAESAGGCALTQSADALYLLVLNHLLLGFIARDETPNERSVRRFIRKLGKLTPLEIVHSIADRLATRGPLAEADNVRRHSAAAEAVLTAYFDPPPAPDPPLITGRDVMQATGLPESPAVGRILAAVKDARDGGKVRTRDEALKLAEEFVRELGRR